MIDSPTYRMAHQLAEVAGDDLDEVLQEMHARGFSSRAISLRLYASYRIEVSHATIANWLRRLDVEDDIGPLARTA